MDIAFTTEAQRHRGVCLCHELRLRGLRFRRQVDVPVTFKGIKLECGHRMDILVEEKVVLELKSVEQIDSVHLAQLLTYLKLSGMPVGLLINFNVEVLHKGIKRRINRPQIL